MKRKRFLSCRAFSLLFALALALGLLAFPGQAQAATAFLFGEDEIELTAGTYSVPVSLKKADNHNTASNAAAAFPSYATLTVDSEGNATLTSELNSVYMASLYDMAYNWKVYQEDSTSGDTVDADVLATRVISSEDNEDNIYMPDGTTEKTVPTKISFAIPDITWDGVYVTMWVDAMNSSPDAWLKIDYANAVESGTTVEKTGTAHMNQFGEYDVNVVVSLLDGKITGVEISGDNFSGSEVSENKIRLQIAADGMKDSYVGKESNDAEGIYKIDAVSGATYSSGVIRDAVMNALGLTYEEEEAIVVPESIDPGIYKVEIAYLTDVVTHSLVENKKADAVLTVQEDGSMTLEFSPVNGTSKEPLYMMDFNGYYTDNDTGKALSLEGVEIEKSDIDYSDENFSEDTQVVTKVTMPLSGGLSAVYNTETYLYVPVMKALNGEISNVDFDNGRFNILSFVKVYWDSREKTADLTKDITDCTFSSIGSKTYTGSAIKPAVTVKDGDTTLTEGTDYTVAYSSNTKVGTATATVTGMGSYTGTKKLTFKITAADISKATFGSVSAKNYTGKAIKPSVTVKYKSKTLVSGTDYKLTYSNNTKMGTATITVTGKGNFKSTKKITFKIIAVKGKTYTSGTNKYKVLNASTTAGTVAYAGTTSKTATSLTIPSTVKLGAVTYKVTQVANKALKGNTKLKTVTVGANVTYVGSDSFRGCTTLTKIVVGKNVKKIGERAFYGDSKLKTITVQSTKLTTVGAKALYGIHKKAVITVPSSKLAAYKKLFKGKGQASTVTIKK